MIKQIQLRGISRTPSDRMTADGGCAESLNVHLDEQELAPTLEPDDITSALGFWEDPGVNALYIHKTSRAENLILMKKARNAREQTAIGYAKNGAFSQFFSFNNETFVDITSIGNTIIISTSRHSHYVLWKQDGQEYIYLGTRIPEPKIEFIDVCGGGDEAVLSRSAYQKDDWDAVHIFDEAVWNGILDGSYDVEDDNYTKYKGEIDGIINAIWSSFQVLFSSNRSKGFFCAPLLARYALKMYDGSYLYQSTPILLGGAGGSHLKSRNMTMSCLASGASVGGVTGCHITTSLSAAGVHKVTAKLVEEFDIGNWKDLIQSIELFLSPEIYSPALYSKFETMEQRYNSGVNPSGQHTGLPGYTGILSLGDALDTEDEDNILKSANFYKIASFAIDDLTKLVDGYEITPVSQDLLLVQQTLPDDQFSHHEVVAAKETMTYNNRILYGGSRTNLYCGHPVFGSTSYFSSADRPGRIIGSGSRSSSGGTIYQPGKIDGSRDYYFIFYVKDIEGNTYKVKQKMLTPSPWVKEDTAGGRTAGGGISNTGAPSGGQATYPDAYGWITYPDTKCYKAQLVYEEDGQFRVHTFTMKEHPNLNCSYCFLGFNVFLLGTDYETLDVNPLDSINNDDAWYYNKKQIMLSEVDNPFLFPIANKLTLSGDIIGVATTTKALSTGQFGEFPMYAFTKDGIWALPISDNGVFAGSRPLARDVAIDGTISPIDQAIVFVTERAVMLLQGSDIRNLSPNMNGDHYRLDDEAYRLLMRNDDWRPLLNVVRDGTPFMSFMKSATIASDYAGNRLICFNEEHPTYQYVLMLDTNTWHKISSPDGIKVARVLNSYPSTYVACWKTIKTLETSHDVSQILNFSTFLDVAKDSADNIRGLIVTRPFDLDAPDQRKVISDIRIRGQYNRNDVKYILLGSMDGLTWGVLPSLRGGSYKLFRLAILTNLSPTERISWVEVNVDTRFTNRFR